MKTLNFAMAALVVCVAAVSSSSHAQEASSYRIRVNGVVPDLCRASTRSAIIDGDRLVVTLERMCNRSHSLRIVAGDAAGVRITEGTTGRSIRGGEAVFSSAAPRAGVETVVIRFEDPDPRKMSNATIRVSVSPAVA